MRPDERDTACLWDMLDAARTVRQFISGRTAKDYEADRMLRAAVERQMEIIGEAARRVSAEFQSKHPDIPWRQIIGQRNVLIHEYGEVDNALIWNVVTARLPALIDHLSKLLPASH